MTTTTPLPCPVCSAPSLVDYTLEDCILCRCSDCGHCFTDLNSIDGMEPYEADYFEKEHRNWFLHPNLRLYAKLWQVIVELNPKASVLDVGCGNGNFLRFLRGKSQDLSLTGIDMALNEPENNVKYLQGDFLHAKLDRKFDVLVSLAVIEHIPDVTAFAKRMHDLCAPGGLVINMTIDERSLIYGSARMLNRAGYSVPLKRLYSKHHVNHFTGPSLRLLLERQGLSTVRVIKHNSPISAVDMPQASALATAILRAGVWAGFQLGQWTNRTMLQTIISRRIDKS